MRTALFSGGPSGGLLRRLLSGGAALHLALAAWSAPAQGAAPAPWQTIGEDLEVKRVTRRPEAVFSPELFFVRTALRRYRAGVIRAQDFGAARGNVRALCLKAEALFGINANFFDENGKALGLVVAHGNLAQRIHLGGQTLTGIFQITGRGAGVIGRDEFSPEAALEAVQAGPRLLTEGRPASGLRDAGSYSRRAGVCTDAQGRLIFYISSGLAGISLGELQEILASGEVGCADALNLDGGGSAQLFLSKHLPAAAALLEEVYIPGSDDVPVVIGLFVKP